MEYINANHITIDADTTANEYEVARTLYNRNRFNQRATQSIEFMLIKRFCKSLRCISAKCNKTLAQCSIQQTITFRLKIVSNFPIIELTAFIAETGRGKFADPDATAKAVQSAARGSYRLPKTVNDTVNQAMFAW